MERLTEKDEQGNKLVLKNSIERRWSISESPTGTQTIRGYAVDKLAKYEDLEEQGLFPKLPCKVGTKVCILRTDIKKIIDGEVVGFRIGECISTADIFIIEDNRYIETTFDNFGKTIFFTVEEALERMEKKGWR